MSMATRSPTAGWVSPVTPATLTYSDLHAEVGRFANALKSIGLNKGDRVAIYMGMVPELPIAMLACARLGIVHSIVFGGFSSDALASRILDADARVVITQDGAWRGGNVVPLKANTDVAVARTPDVEKVIVLRRAENDIHMEEGRDVWWHDLVEGQDTSCEPVHLNAEDPLYILYTSGTTGRPKGIVHTQGGYLTQIMTTHSQVFDLKPDDDVYWCAADIGWVTGHSYIVYGPLANRTTGVMYEGAPNYPDKDRLWQIVEQYGVTIFYTAPTAIRAFMKWGDEYPAGHDLSSLRVLGTVGEPINPEAWIWYHENIGGERCPIVDTWWQTETGGIMISPLPGVTATKPGSATMPLPGISADVVDDDGNSVALGGGGFLVITAALAVDAAHHLGRRPALRRHVLVALRGPLLRRRRRQARRRRLLLAPGPGRRRHAGLGAQHLHHGGRVGPRVAHFAVAEAAVVGRKDDPHRPGHRRLRDPAQHRRRRRSPCSTSCDSTWPLRSAPSPSRSPIVFTDDLPKTRSGKIMRRLLGHLRESPSGRRHHPGQPGRRG